MQKDHGFTLIELGIVLALICLAATLSLRFVPSLTRSYVRADINILYQTMLYVQRHALLTRKKQAIKFNLNENSYTFCDCTHKLANGVCFGTIPSVHGPPSSPHKPLEAACTFKNNQMSCSPEGIIDAGAIYLTDQKKQTLYACTVAVSAYSYIRRYKWQTNWQRMQA